MEVSFFIQLRKYKKGINRPSHVSVLGYGCNNQFLLNHKYMNFFKQIQKAPIYFSCHEYYKKIGPKVRLYQ